MENPKCNHGSKNDHKGKESSILSETRRVSVRNLTKTFEEPKTTTKAGATKTVKELKNEWQERETKGARDFQKKQTSKDLREKTEKEAKNGLKYARSDRKGAKIKTDQPTVTQPQNVNFETTGEEILESTSQSQEDDKGDEKEQESDAKKPCGWEYMIGDTIKTIRELASSLDPNGNEDLKPFEKVEESKAVQYFDDIVKPHSEAASSTDPGGKDFENVKSPNKNKEIGNPNVKKD